MNRFIYKNKLVYEELQDRYCMRCVSEIKKETSSGKKKFQGEEKALMWQNRVNSDVGKFTKFQL